MAAEHTKRYLEEYAEIVEVEEATRKRPRDLRIPKYQERLRCFPPGRILYGAGDNDDIHVPFAGSYVDELRHHQFALLDSVFTSFLDTNRHRGVNYSLERLFTMDNRHNKYFRFMQYDIPYLATVCVYDDYDGDRLNIKLHNDGFTYVPKRGRIVPPRHQCDGWVLLESQGWKDLKGLINAFKSLSDGTAFKTCRVFYNHTERRLDIKMNSEVDGYKNVIITFEDGYPYFDDDVESTPL
ncbi:uncharacterized protein SPPG_05857 [Spizellomyces punctatus DAOM BR117]|uniref:Uncharacterized protein n=1 Tax=Spizellomyces punctatus (strain DAOM BR117) TaxID=645134 RepID=A0A0L0HBC7_SPIPD|nr:uncharacterized protein SPPG_05857 [Spizellomyces punctatus DAOM BR117]KNC98890.1 hypothetical protein SPPG_05857 [Spizellomyces punctatus DAOM BR117]|eukprot:XP_016606930.1 hypothetical protein SPPG_05857 [Spizellomyces punctatus DAOM BR117]